MSLNVTFAMIVLNSDFVLKHVIDSILPYAHKVIISEGPVQYWQDKGFTTSTDVTNTILENYGDKITVIHGQYAEKTEQAQAFEPHIPEDTDYIWFIDADEIFKPEDIRKVFRVLESEKPYDVGFQAFSFFGGFDHYIGGFEHNHNFRRILKYKPFCKIAAHRGVHMEPRLEGRAITGREMAVRGVNMFHYSYVSPHQVRDKIQYYEDSVIKRGDCIPNYFQDVWLAWVNGTSMLRDIIQEKFDGVHEFRPDLRGPARTVRFTGKHPACIDMEDLKLKFQQQLGCL